MADVVDRKTRSRMMSGIRSSNTRPEIRTRHALHRRGYRFRLDSKIGRIKPDIVLRRHRVAIFVHGCYWHQHEHCKLAYSGHDFSARWRKKFADNKQRDQRTLSLLEDEGWRVAVIWECTTRSDSEFEDTLNKLAEFIQSGTSPYFETRYRQR